MARFNECDFLSPLNSAAPNRIHEEFHPTVAVVRRTSPFVTARVALAVFIGAGFVVAVASHLCNLGVADGVIIYAFLGLPLLIASLYSRVIQLRHSESRSLTLVDDVITISTRAETESCPVARCCWFFGKATDDTGLSYQDIRQKAVLIVFPSGRAIACGLSQPLYSQWLEVLRSNHCRKVCRQEGPLGVLFSILVIGGFVLGGAIGQRVGAVVRDSIVQPPQNNQIASLLPAALFVLGAWFGAVCPWFIPGWRRHTERERQQFARFAVLLPAKVAVLAGAVVAGNVISGLVLVLLWAMILLA